MTSETRLANAVRDRLAPEGIWTLRDRMESLLRHTISRLPRGNVSESEERYPTSLHGVRAFLNSLFARHFFQVQDSLLEFASDLIIGPTIESSAFCFADIGSGPAVASLALVDLLDCIKDVRPELESTGVAPIRMLVVLNDVSEPCLKVGQDLLFAYLRGVRGRFAAERIIRVTTPFPRSNAQLRRIARLSRQYDLCCLSYALVPVEEQSGNEAISQGIDRLAGACSAASGRIVILQDKFHEALLRKLCRELAAAPREAQLTQAVYDTQNQNSEHTYTFFRSVYPDPEHVRARNAQQIAVSA